MNQVPVILPTLLLEPDIDDAQRLWMMLSEAGTESLRFYVSHVTTLEEGQNLLASNDNDIALILMSLSLLNVQGLSILSTLQSQTARAQAPVLVLATSTQESLALRAIGAGADSYLLKDHLQQHELVRAIRCAIERQRAIASSRRTIYQHEQRHHHMLEIEEQLRKLSRAVEQSPSSIVITNLNGDIEYVNPKFTQVTGYTFEEVLGQNPRVLKSGELPPEEYRRMWEAIHAGKEWRGEFHNRKKSGELFWEFASISPIVNAEGIPTHFLAIKEDITARKRAEEEVRQAWKAAEAATQAKSAFLANMSHEIRTPLNAIIGLSTLLMNSELPRDEQEYVRTISLCGETLLEIINDILDFSKIEAGKINLSSAPFLLLDLVESSFDLVATRAAEKHLDVAAIIEKETPATLVGDLTRLRQVLVNLLSNAVKFTEQGEVVVTVEASQIGERPIERNAAGSHPSEALDPPPLPSDTRPLYEVHISVRDTGIGIAPEQRDRLFLSFSQLDTPSTVEKGGTGLGLAISKRLVEMMGGTMWVESVFGQGAVFHFTFQAEALPSESTPQQPASITSETSNYDLLRGKHVLIVDDNPTICEVLSRHVRAVGMVPHTTTSAFEALHWVCDASLMLDVAILDIHMPEMDGLVLASHIRTCTRHQNIPLVMTTYVGLTRSEEHTTRLERLTFLFKPIKVARLCQTLLDIFSHQQYPSPGSATQNPIFTRMGSTHPLRILVAEDNKFNQKVIRLLLERMDYKPQVVHNGSDVLTHLEQHPADVVLMDVQMPVMDGFETTRAIRDRWPTRQQPYIIAMTAYVMAGDREQCLAAGMDDYMGKPIRIEELTEALSRATTWHKKMRSHPSPQQQERVEDMPLTSATHPPASPTMPFSTPPVLPVNLTVLENFLAAIGENTPQMVHEVITLFLETAPGLLRDIREAIEQEDSARLTQAAHTLKSSSAQLGAMTFSELCKTLEKTARHGSMEGTHHYLPRVEVEFARVRAVLEAVLHGVKTPLLQ
jgi:PAS domain S-box-containing protein